MMRRPTRARTEQFRPPSLIALGLAVLLSIGAPLAAHAYWSHTPPALTAAVSTATIPTPSQFTCRPSGGLLGLGSTANFSWSALPTGTDWRYQVRLRTPDGSTDAPIEPAGQTATTINIGSGLLTGLLGGILDLLLGGGQAYVRVIAIHPSGWTAVATPEIPIRRATVLGGVTC